MNQQPEPIAAIREKRDDGMEVWKFTTDTATVASLPDDDVIFTTDKDDLFEILNERNGLTESGLGRAVKDWYGVCVYPEPIFSGSGMRTADALEKLTNHLAIDGGTIRVRDLNTSDHDALRPTNIIISPDNIARLDEKKAKARRKGAQTRKDRRPLAVDDIRSFGYGMLGIINKQLQLYHLQTSFGSCTKEDTVAQVMRVLVLFRTLYGNDAHRKLVGFQKLHADWNERPEVNIKAWERTVFGTWMMTEAKEKLPPAVSKEEYNRTVTDNGHECWKLKSLNLRPLVEPEPTEEESATSSAASSSAFFAAATFAGGDDDRLS